MQGDKRVGIVGAGPAGLMAARYAIMNGFQPFVLQKNSGVGGVWNAENGAVWQSMTTNLSKYTCCFKDHPWPQGTAIFPPSKQMTAYIQSYAHRFDLIKHIKFNCSVTFLSHNNQKYQIQYEENGSKKKDQFLFVIVASGIFLHPNIPNIPGKQTFPGTITHSKTYRQGSDFKGKKVLAIGGSFTGVELIGDLSKHSQMAFHSFHNSFWVLPHFLPIGPKQKGKTPRLPIDFFYNRKFYEYGENPNKQTMFKTKNSFYSAVCDQQQKIPEIAIGKQKFNEAHYVAISSSYVDQVKNKRIIAKRCDVERIQGSKVIFKDGSSQNFDSIIFCTGYKSSLNFLSPQIKSIIEFDEQDRLQPVILFQQAYHPKLDHLFFVGVYKGPYFAVLQLQVQWAFNHFMAKSNRPTPQQIQIGLQKQRSIRYKVPRQQFPHNDYIRFADQIASISRKGFCIKQFLNNPNVSKQLKDSFLKMNVFPCMSDAFTFQNLQQQIKESGDLTKNNVIYS